MRTTPHPPGYLAYGQLSFDGARTRPCPRCGGDERERAHHAVCDACRANPDYQEVRRIRRRAMERASRARRLEKTA